LLDTIITNGNRSVRPGRFRGENQIVCRDGFEVSVIAGAGTYCTPRPRWPVADPVPVDYPGPYSHVEVGYPSQRPEPWDEWERYAEDPEQPTDTVYAYVPVALVRALVAAHGGEADR